MVDEVIPKLPQDRRKTWLDAAATFRLPYWDWAQKKSRDGKEIYDVPIIKKNPRIEVVDLNTPSSTVFIDNPMYKFKMPDDERMGCSGVIDVQDTNKDGKILTIPVRKDEIDFSLSCG
jgi:tyrosinase